MEQMFQNLQDQLYFSSHDLIGYKEEQQQLFDVIQRTAEKGESNSLLVIGKRGCGKSLVC